MISRHKFFSNSLTLTLAVCCAAALWYLLTGDPYSGLSVDLPGADGKPSVVFEERPVVIGEYFESFEVAPSSITGSWPRFRGSRFENRAGSGVQLSTRGDLLWQVSLGEGHAGAAVHDGRVYVLDYDEAAGADTLRCFSLETGEEYWRRWYSVKVKRNHGMSRTIPAVTADFVLTMGPKCHVMCLDSKTGDLLWGMDLVSDYGTDEPLWYTGQCPLIDDGIAVIAVGGDELLLGVDCSSGEVVWATPNPEGYGMSHSSIMVMNILGKRTYVYCAIGGIVGVSAEEMDRGKILWETADFDAKVIAPSPVYLGDGGIFATAGYGAGSILLNISRAEDDFSVETVNRTRPNEGFSCEQQTPLVLDGLLYGIVTKDAGPLRGQFVCYDPAGGVLWSSGEKKRFGLGPYLDADGMFLILGDDGTLTMIDANAREYREISSMEILNGVDAWAPMALAGGLLVARDSKTLVCVDLRM